MDAKLEVDLISYLPSKITENILNKLPTKEAIRTSVLSRKWRYKWTTISDLDINLKSCKETSERSLAKSITNYLFLHHQGTVNKFLITHLENQTSILKSLDQWLLLFSHKGIRELSIGLKKPCLFKVPSSHLFNCTELTRLEMIRCKFTKLQIPISFKGFLFLKFIKFQNIMFSDFDYNRFISSCPVLETLVILSNFIESKFNLILSAPNLKNLTVRVTILSIYLENTPLLTSANITTHQLVDDKNVKCCNFDRFFEKIPRLEKLVGRASFAKYLGKGIEERSSVFVQQPYDQLTFIELNNISFEEKDEIRILFLLIINSPNLQKLKISETIKNSGNVDFGNDDEKLNVARVDWKLMVEKECGKKYKEKVLSELKSVEIRNMGGKKSAMLMMLIKFILKKSPKLEFIMFLWPRNVHKFQKLDDLVTLGSYRRASSKARFRVPQFSQITL